MLWRVRGGKVAQLEVNVGKRFECDFGEREGCGVWGCGGVGVWGCGVGGRRRGGGQPKLTEEFLSFEKNVARVRDLIPRPRTCWSVP